MDDDVDEILNENNVQNTQEDDVDMDDELEDVEVPNAEDDEPMDEEEPEEEGEDDDEEDDDDDDDDDDEDRSDDEDDDRSDDEDRSDDDDDDRSDDDDDDDEGDDDDDETDNAGEGAKSGAKKQSEQPEDQKSITDNADEQRSMSETAFSASASSSPSSSSDGKPVEMSKLDKIHKYYTTLYQSASVSESYNILPTAAIPIQTNVQTLTMSKGLRYLFLGGSDGFIRKFDFLNTVDGKLSLTIQQKNALVDSIVNAGILTSYWENEVPQPASKVKWVKQKSEYIPVVSPVHSLAVQNECLFILAGQESGGIVMQGVRYFEGRTSHYFKGHKSIVNHLLLNDDETRFLSGSWDKTVIEWDLETGAQLTKFNTASQLSSLEFRPINAAFELSEPKPSTPDLKENISNVVGDTDDADMDVDTNSLFGDDDDEDEDEEANVDSNNEKVEDTVSQEDKDTAELNNGESKKNSESDIISRNTLSLKTDENIFLTSCIDGNIQIWDKRQPHSQIIKLGRHLSTPPWCMSACWSVDGSKVIAGRRNAVVEIYDLRKPETTESKLRLPLISGPVSKVKAMPNNRHVIAASTDNIRIFDITNIDKTPLITPGHHGGCISNLYVDPTCRFMISTSGNRGWQGIATDVTLIYDVELN